MNRVYGKRRGDRSFRAMDLGRGMQVKSLIYASLVTDEEAARFMQQEAPRNPDWTFEIRKVAASADFTVHNHGSVMILNAHTNAARHWRDEHLPNHAMTWGRDGVVVEPRYIADIVNGVREAGLSVG
jgi:hypothetical protein